MVHGLIFCAGLGTRLKPLTDTMPKALVPIAGKSLLQWQVERLRDAGITDIVINVHHFPDQIIDAIRSNNGWGCNIRISDERDRLLDTGGGLRKAGELLGEGLILACNVDILSNIDIRALIAAHNPQNIGTLVVSDRKTQRYLLFDDNLTLRGWTNIATSEVKPDFLSSIAHYRLLAFSGMQVLSPAIFNHMDRVVAQKGDKFSLIDLYLSVCEQDRSSFNIPHSTFSAFIPEDYRMMDVGKIDQIDEAERFAETLYTKK